MQSCKKLEDKQNMFKRVGILTSLYRILQLQGWMDLSIAKNGKMIPAYPAHPYTIENCKSILP